MIRPYGTNYSSGTSTVTLGGNPIPSHCRLLVIMIATDTTTPRTGGAPYWSTSSTTQSFTQAGSTVIGSAECTSELWYLVDPSVGTYPVVVPNSGGVTAMCQFQSYIETDPACTIAVFSTHSTNVSTASPSLTINSVPAGGIVIEALGSGYKDIPSANNGGILLTSTDMGAWGATFQYQYYWGTQIAIGGSSTADFSLYSGSSTRISQSFTGTVSTLKTITFLLTKSGSPTGTLTAKLYSHSGTYGTSSVPGTLLATSTHTIDASFVTTSLFYADFTFAPYSLSATYYVAVLEFTSTFSNSSNKIMSKGTTTTSATGNKAEYVSSWTPNSSHDIVLGVYADDTSNITLSHTLGSSDDIAMSMASIYGIPAGKDVPVSLLTTALSLNTPTISIQTNKTVTPNALSLSVEEIEPSYDNLLPFPTTGILDDFNRGNSSTLGGNWTVYLNGIRIVSQMAQGTSDASNDYEYWNTAYGAGQEAYITIVDKGNQDLSGCLLYICGNLSGIDAYLIEVRNVTTGDGVDWIKLFREDDSVTYQLGDTHYEELVNGCKVGIRAVNGVVSAWLDNNGSGWHKIIEVEDDTYSTGSFALGTCDDSTILDDFGGGEYSAVEQTDVPVSAQGLSATANAPTILISSTVAVSSQASALSTQAPSLSLGNTTTQSLLTDTLTANAPAVKTDWTVTPSALALALSIQTPSYLRSETYSASELSLSLEQGAPDISTSGGAKDVFPEVLEALLSVYAPAIIIDGYVSASSLALALSTQSPSIAVSELILETVLDISATAQAPSYRIDTELTQSAQSVTLAVYSPSIVIDDTEAVGELTGSITPYDPTVDIFEITELYYKDALVSLPNSDIALTEFTEQEYTDVSASNDTRVGVTVG